jgi:lysophospholipase L1-like esterase
MRRTRVIAFYVTAFLVITAGSIWLALRVTPLQTVSAAGQTARVGAASFSFSLSGPGELDLFGQAIPTRPRFDGPIRPRLQLTRISIDPEVADLARADGRRKLELSLSQQLASGWTHYFVWETLIAAGFAAVLLVAVSGVCRQSRRTMLKMLAAGVATVCAVNVGGVLLTASSTPRILRSVKTLDDLVGTDPLQATPEARARPLHGVQAVVIGDSTAAGLGNPLVTDPSALDRACGRSGDAYAADLAAVNGWNVLNLACSSATIQNGLLGAQVLDDGAVAPPQLTEAERATTARAVIVSVGANDIGWSTMTQLCAVSTVCNDKVSAAYFKQQLGTFTRSYYELLGELADLPGRPAILINQYYAPFGSDIGCLTRYGMTAAKEKVLLSRLAQLNDTLARGAATFGFGVVRPEFTGHQLCSAQPYVQGMDDAAPLHPTAAGELAIALADQQALPKAEEPTPSPSATPASRLG